MKATMATMSKRTSTIKITIKGPLRKERGSRTTDDGLSKEETVVPLPPRTIQRYSWMWIVTFALAPTFSVCPCKLPSLILTGIRCDTFVKFPVA